MVEVYCFDLVEFMGFLCGYFDFEFGMWVFVELQVCDICVFLVYCWCEGLVDVLIVRLLFVIKSFYCWLDCLYGVENLEIVFLMGLKWGQCLLCLVFEIVVKDMLEQVEIIQEEFWIVVWDVVVFSLMYGVGL